MITALERVAPDGLAVRFALVLAAALVTANLVALLLLSLESARLGREARDDREIDRIVALVPVLEKVEPVLRAAIAYDASHRTVRVDVDRLPLVETGTGEARAVVLGARLAAALAPRAVRVALLEASPDGRRHDPAADREGDLPPPDRRMLAMSIALDVPSDPPGDDVWLNVISRTGEPPYNGVREGLFLLFLGVSLAAVLGVGLLFVRRLTRPLSQLAAAARAAGRGDRSVRVPERGARELREAAAAFNAMQTRIARFDAERTRTVAAVGHDLRTPITSLRIRAEMLEEETREPMVRTLEQMAVMADGLVAWSRDRNASEARRPTALGELLRGLCEERGASIEASADPVVAIQPVALSRAIGNLVDNALRYGRTARLNLSRERDHAVIRIEDDGPGIPHERLADLFEPFVRGEGSRGTDTGGAGLGLTIARSIVRAHGGTIELANREGGGLLVTVTLPVRTPGPRVEPYA